MLIKIHFIPLDDDNDDYDDDYDDDDMNENDENETNLDRNISI